LGFPISGTERVNYGESIKNIGARVINNSDNNIKVGIKIEVRSVERDEQVYGKFIYTNSSFSSGEDSTSSYCCNKTIKIEKADFTPGQYKVRASLALLTPFGKLRKGQELDVSTKSFFVEVDPPKGGIWEDFIAVDFSNYDGDQKTRRAFHDIGSRPGTYVLKYNKEHADHKMIKDTDEKSIAQYRYRLTIPELCLLDIDNEWNVIFSEDDRKQGIGRIAEVMKDTVDKFTDSKYVDDM
jgi:hypothetical protein